MWITENWIRSKIFLLQEDKWKDNFQLKSNIAKHGRPSSIPASAAAWRQCSEPAVTDITSAKAETEVKFETKHHHRELAMEPLSTSKQ